MFEDPWSGKPEETSSDEFMLGGNGWRNNKIKLFITALNSKIMQGRQNKVQMIY